MSEGKAPTHPGVAAVLSFVFSGLGQIYNGQIKKGLALVLATTIGLVLVVLSAVALAVALYKNVLTLKIASVSVAVMFAGGLIICWVGIYSIFDAYKNA